MYPSESGTRDRVLGPAHLAAASLGIGVPIVTAGILVAALFSPVLWTSVPLVMLGVFVANSANLYRVPGAPSDPRGTWTVPQRDRHWRGIFRNLHFGGARPGRLFRKARGVERFRGTSEAPQVLYTASRIRVEAPERGDVGIGRRVCGVRQGVAWGTHSTGRREVRRGTANLERDDRPQTRGDCAVQGHGRRGPIDRLREGPWIRLGRPRRWTQRVGERGVRRWPRNRSVS